MKFLLGLIIGAAIAASGVYWFMNGLGSDVLLQCRLTAINANLAIYSGIADGKERRVLQFIREVTRMELDEIESGADDAFLPDTRKRVAAMLERRLRIEETLSTLPSAKAPDTHNSEISYPPVSD